MPTGRRGGFQRVKATAEGEHSRNRRAGADTILEKPRLHTYKILPRAREGASESPRLAHPHKLEDEVLRTSQTDFVCAEFVSAEVGRRDQVPAPRPGASLVPSHGSAHTTSAVCGTKHASSRAAVNSMGIEETVFAHSELTNIDHDPEIQAILDIYR